MMIRPKRGKTDFVRREVCLTVDFSNWGTVAQMSELGEAINKCQSSESSNIKNRRTTVVSTSTFAYGVCHSVQRSCFLRV